MLDVIEHKVNGEDAVGAQQEHEEARIIEIMEALIASLKDTGDGRKKPRAAGKKQPASNKKPAAKKKSATSRAKKSSQ